MTRDAFGNELPPGEEPEFDEAALVAAEQAKQERAEQLRALDRVQSIAYVLKDPAGRQFLWDLMARGEVFGGSFDADPYKAAFNEGKRQFAVAIFALIDHHNFYLMQCEHREREARYHVMPTEKETP